MVIVICFLGIIVFLPLGILINWHFYKLRGRAQPDADDDNQPVITGPGDALSQRLIDLYTEEKSEKKK